jgi:hypothetical protein
MSHDEAFELIPVYALGALEDARELEAHLLICPICTAELARQLETTAALAEAVEPLAPPPALRARVLAHAAPPVDRRAESVRELRPEPGPVRSSAVTVPRRRPWDSLRLSWLATAAAVLLVVGLAANNVSQQRQVQATQAQLVLDQRGLDLLTSTETANARLNPVAPLGEPSHGHWFHRGGVATQVLVVESMPVPPGREAYWAWLQRKDGAWIAAGRFTLDSTGYARIILTGDDGSDVARVEVTRQVGGSSSPSGVVVLAGS